jgi:hypothetical protein
LVQEIAEFAETPAFPESFIDWSEKNGILSMICIEPRWIKEDSEKMFMKKELVQ